MSAEAWRPGSYAERLALEEPYPGVPSHLRHPLIGWVRNAVGGYRLIGDLLIYLRASERMVFDYQGLEDAMFTDEAYHLDCIEACLMLLSKKFPDDPRLSGELRSLLETGNSMYRVRGDYAGLEYMVTPELRDTAIKAASRGTPASTHITEAWNNAYGRHHDAVKGYGEAIKAVEAAGKGLISPSSGRATLGTMIKDMNAKPGKWDSVFRDKVPDHAVDTVKSMMRTLWDGQTSRHGDSTPTVHETLDQARAAVVLALSLVQLFETGAFKLK